MDLVKIKMQFENVHDEPKTMHRVLELFSGIGGMHYAIRRSGKLFQIMAAIDINPVANSIYNHNFGLGTAKSSNIVGLTAERITKLGVDVILMSPPCQPFSCNGNFKDVEDHRADPFVHICNLLDKVPTVQFILMENVKGFVRSQARELYKTRLGAAGFHCKEYVLSPHDFGVPNTRHRYYCVAKRAPFGSPAGDIITRPSVRHMVPLKTIGEMVEREGEHLDMYLVKLEILRKRLPVMDVCTPESTNSMCFTKAYTHYAEGTGSVYSPLSRAEFDRIYSDMRSADSEEGRMLCLKTLKVRYFTPQEVAKLMSFPEDFSFPTGATDKQCYRVLGNSINVLVVSSLFDEIE
ncbi:tRNA (cytosine(38)-C(5))-methyltransferase [Toxorhynchites rutilus septentrionalis]|uniref:tRNA (cytosine(38)-C(5))-methyltransferase n=1 Tax=Toxorhynchites rutilus septentrionalis TaxID=329112 RepID=UPI0024796837|nr:tRNA (cytosine(38)-C(5))-methyltransferase [Toxorhynchites rutilus septentrionalis]